MQMAEEEEEEGEEEGEERVARDLHCWTRDTRMRIKEGENGSVATNIWRRWKQEQCRHC